MKPIEINYQEPNFTPPPQGTRIEDISGTFPYTAAVVPTWVPKTFRDSFAIYKSGATLRLYIYDVNNATWHYATLT